MARRRGSSSQVAALASKVVDMGEALRLALHAKRAGVQSVMLAGSFTRMAEVAAAGDQEGAVGTVGTLRAM